MPIWAWAFFLAGLTYSGFRLWKARTTGSQRYGPFSYGRATDPVFFWMLTVVHAAIFVFLGGLLSLVVAKSVLHLW